MHKPIVLCIGTNKVIGDSLGPTIGDLLIMRYNINAYVYGHTAKPVNGKNYNDYIKHIHLHHRRSLVIATDACVGSIKDIGKIKCSLKGIKAGGALQKEYGNIGDIGILGVVAGAQRDNLAVLSNVDALLIKRMSTSIARIIIKLVANINSVRDLNNKEFYNF